MDSWGVQDLSWTRTPAKLKFGLRTIAKLKFGQLQKEGKSVGFVGDGINDAIAMKKANVSISLTGASSIATDVAEVVLMDGTLHHLTDLFDIAQSLKGNLRTSLGITLVPTAINLSGAV